MISLNTNLTSQLVASNLKSSSVGLNNAIERMTTGFKLNHAKDNAANFSISTSLSTKLGAYNVAQENAAMGLDMIQTASSSLSLMSNLGSRLHSLAIQANNGTYGGSSLDAIQSEASSIVQELFRIAGTTQYNGMYLFGGGQSSSNIATNAIATLSAATASTAQIDTQAATTTPKATSSGFIKNIKQRDTSKMTALSECQSNTPLADGTYSISSAKELEQLAEMTNNGLVSKNTEFVLASDIDLSNYQGTWTPIGENSAFNGSFDGNGYKIKNLIVEYNGNNGLFGQIESGTISNLGIENSVIRTSKNHQGGLLCGEANNATIENCYSTGSIGATETVGGLIGNVTNNSTINNCYSKARIEASNGEFVGGLCGSVTDSKIANCFATGDVYSPQGMVGGLAGAASNVTLENSYTAGNIESATTSTGGLFGEAEGSIKNCFTTGNIKGTDFVGGLVGLANGISIENSYSKGNVTGTSYIGGLVGSGIANIVGSYTSGTISGDEAVGGLMGFADGATIRKSYSSSNIEAPVSAGGLVGKSDSSTIDYSFFNGTVAGIESTGGLVGDASGGTISNSYTNGSVSDNGDAGSITGNCKRATLKNVYYTAKAGIDQTHGTNTGGSADAQKIVSKELKELIAQGILYSNTGAGFNATLQVGIHGTESDKIEVSIDTLDLTSLENLDLSNGNAIDTINKFLKNINEQQTSLGAVENRLMSAIESIGVNIENLTSTQSTIRDADIAKESSEYIRNQILQQAAATLLATANQNPSIALQLL